MRAGGVAIDGGWAEPCWHRYAYRHRTLLRIHAFRGNIWPAYECETMTSRDINAMLNE